MPAAEVVLLPLCVGLALLGVIITGLAWRRGNKGRVLQGIAVVLAPIALFITGLLKLLWDGVVAVVTWASRVIPSPSVWVGLSLLGVCLVLWVVGGLVARRAPAKPKQKRADAKGSADRSPAAVKGGRTPSPETRGAVTRGQAPAKAPVDDDMAEIEALLKSRGID